MRRLNYQYHMRLSFPLPVENHHFTLRCLPIVDERQQIENQNIYIEPSYIGGYDADSFGNRFIYGTVKNAHTQFLVKVTGTACVDAALPVPASELHKIGMFRYQTRLTGMGASLHKLREKCEKKKADQTMYEDKHLKRNSFEKEEWEQNDIVERACELMDVVYQNFEYEPGVTNVTTTAEEAAMLGRGVCQDYAHILLALCRMEWIPCRYVVGMMLGEGASHAWIEVCDGTNWIALDPTHNRMVDDTYIRISYGRDAQDCTINQGFFYGSREQVQEILVVVEEMKE